MSNSNNVTTGKPKIGGAIYCAPVGTPLPVNASATLSDTWKGLGYISEDGFVNGMALESDNSKAWGGDVVLTYQKSRDDTFGFTLIEAMNIEVLKRVFGSSNVAADENGRISVAANNKELDEASWVVDMILKGGVAKRIVIPKASVTEIGEVVYKDDEAVGYETTITAKADASGNTHYEYLETSDVPSGDKQITAFVIGTAIGIIDQDAHTIAVEVPSGTSLAALSPAVIISAGASVSPASGTSKDFTSPVAYTVTAADESTQEYIVTVTAQ